MGQEDVQSYFNKIGRNDLQIMEFPLSSATVELAAIAVGAPPAQIAKTLTIHLKDKDIIVVMSGSHRISNKKFKQHFHCKAKFMTIEEAMATTGHPVGGVCPFGLKTPIEIYLDQSLGDFKYVYPAAGAANTAVKVLTEELPQLTGGTWIDVCE